MNLKKERTSDDRGFALLITLVVVSVVLAIGLSLLFVTTRQYLLAVTAIESEKSFQAAQIGLECMRFHRNQTATRAILLKEGTPTPPPPSLACAGVTSASLAQATALYNQTGRLLYNYRYRYNINVAGASVCSEPSLYIADFRNYNPANPADREFSINIQNLNLNEGLPEITCTAGTICTAVFARGYNRPCGQLDSIFTVQREITVEY